MRRERKWLSQESTGKPTLSCLCLQLPHVSTFKRPAAHVPHLSVICSQHLQLKLRVSSSDTQTHPQESPYLQSRGPVPRVRTGVAGTLRPSKLEALLGSERVGLDKDGRPTSGPRLETAPTSRPSCQPRLRIPFLVPGKWKTGSSLPGGAGHRVAPALQVPINIRWGRFPWGSPLRAPPRYCPKLIPGLWW